jgi:MFS family permease
MVMRVGARVWLSVLLIGWGAVATSSAFITNKEGFYAVRILLGAFEAGAFPGMWYYLTLFFAADR